MIARLLAEWQAMLLRQKIEEVAKLIAVITFALWALVLVTGCSATPYAAVGLGYQVDAASSPLIRTAQPQQCSDNLQGRFAAGLDWGRVELEYFHQSWVACGSPFNDRPELSADSINLTYRLGGK